MHKPLRFGLLLALLTAALALTGAAGAAPGDVDNDTIANASDNCPTVYNIDQHDNDGDSIGNACDATPGISENGFPGSTTLHLPPGRYDGWASNCRPDQPHAA